jgi:uncharacterized protein (DUF2141 family)
MLIGVFCLGSTWGSLAVSGFESSPVPLQEAESSHDVRVPATSDDSLQSDGGVQQPLVEEGLTTIRVFAEGLRHEEGRVRVSLYANADGFPDHVEKCLQWGFARSLGDRAYMVFRPVKPGHYAVAAFHDEDGNGELKKDWLGRPREGWGVSRDAQGHFGPPHFEDAAFEARGDTMTIHFRLRY